MNIFKKGDKVFDVFLGWGKVIGDKVSETYPLEVDFGGCIKVYTEHGLHYWEDQHPRLSFTEYDLVNGGFSQERPEPKIERGTPCFVSDDKDCWVAGVYIKRVPQHFYHIHKVIVNPNRPVSEYYKHVRLDHPFKKNNENNN